MRIVWFVAALAGCADPVEGGAEGELSTARVIEEGTPQAVGVLAMLNDPGTTLDTLDIDAALDKRAATNLIAHRDGADKRPGTADDDKFGTIAEVDAVSYVGDAALSALLAYATDNDWIPAGDDYYGTIETVSFTVTEAGAVVQLCNTASFTTLDVEASLDSRAAKGIVDTRPFTTVEQIAAVSYVGASALGNLKSYAASHAGGPLTTLAAVTALTAATPGLYYTSESDFPLIVEVVPHPGVTTATVDNIKSLIAANYVARPEEPTLADRAVEPITIAALFDRYTVPQDWWEENNTADQPKWAALRTVYDSGLVGSTVFRFGPKDQFGRLYGSIDVYIVGFSAEGDLVVMKTIAVET
jgi:hypothetical protein